MTGLMVDSRSSLIADTNINFLLLRKPGLSFLSVPSSELLASLEAARL